MAEFIKGKQFDFGKRSLSESEIIEFARKFDPLDFHVDKDAAAKSIFGGIVASGSQMFMAVHRDRWIPLFKGTFLAGMGINAWKFLKPIYADQLIHARVTILEVVPKLKGKRAVVTWLYEFTDEKGELVQRLELTALHKFS